jgi:hypothetical protein
MDIQTGSDPADPLDPGVSVHLGSPRAGLEDGPLSEEQWVTVLKSSQTLFKVYLKDTVVFDDWSCESNI